MRPTIAKGMALARKVQVRQIVALITASARNGRAYGANARKCRVEPGALAMNRAAHKMSLIPAPT